MSLPRQLSVTQLGRAMRSIAPLARAFDLLQEHVVITDTDGHILYANAAAVRETGYALNEMLGKNPGDLWGGKMPKAYYRHMWKTVKEGRQFSGEVRNVRKDGSETWQDLRISPVMGAKGKPSFFIAVETVITGRKRRELAHEELESLVSHEALSPATSVRWNIDELLSLKKLRVSERKLLRSIAEQNIRTVNIVRDLTSLARLGKGHPQFKNVDISIDLERALAESSIRHAPINGPLVVRAIPSLVTEFFSVLTVLVDSNKPSGSRCGASRSGNTLTIHCTGSFPKKNGEREILTASLIARYLHWELRMHKKGTRMEYRLSIPLLS